MYGTAFRLYRSGRSRWPTRSRRRPPRRTVARHPRKARPEATSSACMSRRTAHQARRDCRRRAHQSADTTPPRRAERANRMDHSWRACALAVPRVVRRRASPRRVPRRHARDDAPHTGDPRRERRGARATLTRQSSTWSDRQRSSAEPGAAGWPLRTGRAPRSAWQAIRATPPSSEVSVAQHAASGDDKHLYSGHSPSPAQCRAQAEPRIHRAPDLRRFGAALSGRSVERPAIGESGDRTRPGGFGSRGKPLRALAEEMAIRAPRRSPHDRPRHATANARRHPRTVGRRVGLVAHAARAPANHEALTARAGAGRVSCPHRFSAAALTAARGLFAPNRVGDASPRRAR